jgi:nucleotide-binding universal stress UspA family protein
VEPFEPKLIVVPTDLSEPAAHALRYASSLGERFGAHLLVIYATSFVPPIDYTAGAGAMLDFPLDAAIERAREELQRHAEENVSANVPFDVRVVVAEPLDAILDQVRESGANLVVMGTHGRTGVMRLMFGSVTEAVMRLVPVPVIAVNPNSATRDVRKVLCPVTLSPACRNALETAASIVTGRKAPLMLLRSMEDHDAHNGAQELMRLQRWLPHELVDRCELKLVSESENADDIVQLARDVHADLIAFGIPADRSVVDSLRGTIGERIVQRSGCPVLTVNAYAARVFSEASGRHIAAPAAPFATSAF